MAETVFVQCKDSSRRVTGMDRILLAAVVPLLTRQMRHCSNAALPMPCIHGPVVSRPWLARIYQDSQVRPRSHAGSISGEMMTDPSICSRRPDDGTAAALVARLVPAAQPFLTEPELLAARPCRPGPWLCSIAIPAARPCATPDPCARQRHGWRVAPCGRVNRTVPAARRVRARWMSAATAFRVK